MEAVKGRWIVRGRGTRGMRVEAWRMKVRNSEGDDIVRVVSVRLGREMMRFLGGSDVEMRGYEFGLPVGVERYMYVR